MKAFPLIRIKWSNEHSMAAVFFVLILYHLPVWRDNPVGIFRFLLLVTEGLLLDIVGSILRYKRVWCCVSAAVTAAMVSLLTQGVPLWGQLLGVAIALLLGKHVWGGTGKNIVNPAMIGLLPILLFFDVPYPFFLPSLLLLPAIILGLLFLKVRPFSGIGFMVGMIVALFFIKELTALNLISYGVFFWGCLVLTDPVTVLPHPVGGLALGFMAGFVALFYNQSPIYIVIVILAINLLTEVISKDINNNPIVAKARMKSPKIVPYNGNSTEIIDLTSEKDITGKKDITGEKDLNREKDLPSKKDYCTENKNNSSLLSVESILNRIKANEVYGMGGAAFSTYRKLMTVLEAKENDKHLIINGVECDPGLIHDYWLLRNRSEEIQKGIDLLCKCVDFQSVHLTAKDIEGLNYSNTISISQIPDLYPMGAERILIDKVLDKKIASDQIPAVSGILVLNVQTVHAIYQAVYQNKMADTRFLTVANLKNKTAHVVKVKLGMKIKEVMDAVYPGIINIFVGGGIMQGYLSEEGAVVDPSINFIAAGTFPNYKESPQCSKCGICSENCPSSLGVNLIADLVDQGKIKDTEKYRVNECIECGSCSYSCLAGRNLLLRVKAAKEAMR